MSECKDIAFLGGVILVILLNLFTFCLGISEAVFVSKYDEYQGECSNIWGWMVAACVVDICAPVFSCCGLKRIANSDDDDDKSTLGELVHIGGAVVAIWSMVTYYKISSSCQDFWETNASELWTFVMIHYVSAWVGICIICLAILVGIVACCTMCCTGSSSTSHTATETADQEVINDFMSSMGKRPAGFNAAANGLHKVDVVV